MSLKQMLHKLGAGAKRFLAWYNSGHQRKKWLWEGYILCFFVGVTFVIQSLMLEKWGDLFFGVATAQVGLLYIGKDVLKTCREAVQALFSLGVLLYIAGGIVLLAGAALNISFLTNTANFFLFLVSSLLLTAGFGGYISIVLMKRKTVA